MATLRATDTSALVPQSREVVSRLAELKHISDYYLAGSAALAIYLRHRPVRNLDLMSPVSRLRAIERRDFLEELVGWDPATSVETARGGFLYVRVGEEMLHQLQHQMR